MEKIKVVSKEHIRLQCGRDTLRKLDAYEKQISELKAENKRIIEECKHQPLLDKISRLERELSDTKLRLEAHDQMLNNTGLENERLLGILSATEDTLHRTEKEHHEYVMSWKMTLDNARIEAKQEVFKDIEELFNDEGVLDTIWLTMSETMFDAIQRVKEKPSQNRAQG